MKIIRAKPRNSDGLLSFANVPVILLWIQIKISEDSKCCYV